MPVEIQSPSPRGHPGYGLQQPGQPGFQRVPDLRSKTNIVAGGFSGIGLPCRRPSVPVARPDTPVLALIGDGSLPQTGTELAAAAMLCRCGRRPQQRWMGSDQGSGDQSVRRRAQGHHQLDDARRQPYFADVTNFAQSLGCRAERVEDPDKLADAVERAFATPDPSY
jgi:acetolactate synthase-1/2/3 large subunit